MPKFFVNNEQINDERIIILGEDVNHIKNVLRLKVNDKITICNTYNSNNYLSEIIEIEKNHVTCKIVEQLESNAEAKTHIHILQGLPKNEKMELVIEKAVEIGVKEITPVSMKRCVVKLDDKAKVKKVDRWQKISEIAAKQSGRDIIPKINNVISLNNIYELLKDYDIVLVAYENERDNTLKNELIKLKETNEKSSTQGLRIAVLIGPEGGIEEQEIEFLKNNGAHIVTLGNRILRTETVALSVASVIIYEFEN